MAPKQNRNTSKQDYGTPPEFLAAVRRLLRIGHFALDIAASEDNAVAERFYTKEQDAFRHAWKAAGWSWLNPPFANIGPWVARACKQSRISQGGAHIAVLVPASIGANWWRDYVEGHALVLGLNGRIQFVGATDPYPKDCALLLYGPYITGGQRIWTWPDPLSDPLGI